MFYKINSRQITLREFCFDNVVSGILVGGLLKAFRVPIQSSTDDPPIELLAPFEVAEESVPPEIRLRFAPLVAELISLGFHSPIYHSIKDPLHRAQYYLATFAHASGQAIARIHNRHWAQAHPPRDYLFVNFISGFTDGTWLYTSSGRRDTLAPNSVRENRLKGTPATALWQSHNALLQQELLRKAAYNTQTQEYARALAELFHGTLRDFHIGRGVFVPPTQADLDKAAAANLAVQEAQMAGTRYPEIQAEIKALQQKHSTWKNALLLLVISLVLFFGAGSARWDWDFVLILIPVLFFHELGHYLAMRIFKYRNLRMFFIPFLGAAVSGTNYNVPGWKKIIVFLMGPVPGIALGIGFGIAAVYTGHEWMNKLAFIMLILNGFNLLPFLPLDGGWVMHILIFSRHYILDFVFRLLGVLALAGLGLALGDRILMFFAIFLGLALHGSLKMAKISAKLRRSILPIASSQEDAIPPETADLIIGEIKEAFPRGINNKIAAQRTLNIYEALNAHPPGWLGSIFFMGIHLASFTAALVFGVVFLLAREGKLAEILELRATAPKQRLHCELISLPSADTKRENTVLVATYSSTNTASEIFSGFGSNFEPPVNSLLFGQSILVSFAATNDTLRAALEKALQPQSTNLFMPGTNLNVSFTLSCKAPDRASATKIFTEVENYFAAPRDYYALPPWSPTNHLSALEWEQAAVARATYGRLQKIETELFSAEIEAMVKDAVPSNENSQTNSDSSGIVDSRFERVRKEKFQAVAADPAADSKLIDLYLQAPGLLSTNSSQSAVLDEIAKRLGQMPLQDGEPQWEFARSAISWGNVWKGSRNLRFSNLEFYDLFSGPPALVQWLCDQGCIRFRYAFTVHESTATDDAETRHDEEEE